MNLDRIFVKGYGFLSFAKTMGKNVSNKYSQSIDSKRAIQKAAEASGDLIGIKFADKTAKKSSKELHLKNENKLEIPKERYISTEKRQKIIDELRLT